MVVALTVAHFVSRQMLALGARGGACHRRALLAVVAREEGRAAAAVLEGVGRVFHAGASVLADDGAPLFVLAVRPAEPRRAMAERLAAGQEAAPPVPTVQPSAAEVLNFSTA